MKYQLEITHSHTPAHTVREDRTTTWQFAILNDVFNFIERRVPGLVGATITSRGKLIGHISHDLSMAGKLTSLDNPRWNRRLRQFADGWCDPVPCAEVQLYWDRNKYCVDTFFPDSTGALSTLVLGRHVTHRATLVKAADGSCRARSILREGDVAYAFSRYEPDETKPEDALLMAAVRDVTEKINQAS